MPLPPGPREPAALQTLEWLARPTAFLHRCHARHGDAFTIRLAFDDAPTVVLADPEAIRTVFGAPDVARRGEAPGILAPVTGPRSISVLDGAEHLRVRRLLSAPFHGEALWGWREGLASVAAEHVARLPRGRPVALLPAMGELTLDAILRVVLGVRDDALARESRAALDHVRALPRAAALSLRPPSSAVWRPFLRHVRAAEARIGAVVAARRTERRADDPSVLGHLLAAGCDDEEVRDHVLTLVAAGHDTTTGALAWAAERLARHPAWQDAAREGLPVQAPGQHPGDRTGSAPGATAGPGARHAPSAPAAPHAPRAVLDAVVRETLRTRPVLTVAPRRLAAPLTLAGHELPAGVHVAPSLLLAGRDGRAHPDPDRFDPGRWLRDPAPPALSWIPFGGGTRRCTGAAFAQLEMAVVLEALLAAGRLRPEPGHERPERARRRGVTLQPGRGARVILQA